MLRESRKYKLFGKTERRFRWNFAFCFFAGNAQRGILGRANSFYRAESFFLLLYSFCA